MARKAPTLADLVDQLLLTVRQADGQLYSYKDVAEEVERRGLGTIAPESVRALRKGIRNNPTRKHMEMLASVFGIPVAAFVDVDVRTRVCAQLAALRKQRGTTENMPTGNPDDLDEQAAFARAAGALPEAKRHMLWNLLEVVSGDEDDSRTR